SALAAVSVLMVSICPLVPAPPLPPALPPPPPPPAATAKPRGRLMANAAAMATIDPCNCFVMSFFLVWVSESRYPPDMWAGGSGWFSSNVMRHIPEDRHCLDDDRQQPRRFSSR